MQFTVQRIGIIEYFLPITQDSLGDQELIRKDLVDLDGQFSDQVRVNMVCGILDEAQQQIEQFDEC